MGSQKDTSLLELLNTLVSAIFDDILLNGHDASFEDFTILLKENNRFKLHLKESLLIKRDVTNQNLIEIFIAIP